MVIGIIGALNKEVELIKEQMVKIEPKEILGNTFYKGNLFNKEVVLCECSIGKVNAAITTTAMVMEYKPDVIINTGISGSLNTNVKVLDTVIANKISLHDEGEEFSRYYPFKTSFDILEKLITIAKQAAKTLNNVHIGEVITGDVFVNSNAKKQELKKNFKNAITVDMEVGAIAKACFRSKTDLLVIKTISDEADDKAKICFDNFIDSASEKSSAMVLKIIELLQQ